MENLFYILNSASSNIMPFFMVFTRIAAIFLVIPFFHSARIPNLMKLMISLTFTIIVFPIVKTEIDIMALTYFEIFYKIAAELFIGISIGFIIAAVFSAIQGAGRLIDVMGGFGFSSVLDPINNSNTTVTSDFYTVIATTLFFTIGGHRTLIEGIAQSYSLVPLGTFTVNSAMIQILSRSFTGILLMALKIAAPLMAVLFLTEVVLALLSRALPSMNIFVIGFPIKIAVTVLITGFTLINTVPYFEVLFKDSFINIDYFLKAIRLRG
jgi:flagellar biosynthesis protein FliR